MRNALKLTAHLLATVLVAPALLSYVMRRSILGADRALEGSTQALSLVPGLVGCYVRRAFLVRVLAHCDWTATVEFGTILSKAGTRLGPNVYVGPRCHLGLVHVERDALIAAAVHVPSGAATHGTADIDRPIREQPGVRAIVRIGEGAWVGSGAIILADIGRHAVVGAGAVVTTAVPEYAVAVGIPARVVRDRRGLAAQA